MATAAGGKALAASGLPAADIDLVIVATCTAETADPQRRRHRGDRLGIAAPGAYDLNAACAGFCYALATASDAVRAGSARYVLVIGAEKLSQWVDWTDRSTCIIFADGAGAAVVGPVSRPQAGPGIGPVVWGSDGAMADKIAIKDRNSFLMQEGQAVFRWATTALHPVARKACELAGVDPAELAAFVPHQANLRIIEAIARKLGAPQARVADDIVHAGNTSSASIPLALSRMIERGEIGSGDSRAAAGFRGGHQLRRPGDHSSLAGPWRRGHGPPGAIPPPDEGEDRHMAMNEAEILTGLGEIIDEVAGVPADEVTPDKSFVDDLDIDSLSMVEIAVAAQDKFGVEIPDDQLKNLKTVQDVIDYVRNTGVSA